MSAGISCKNCVSGALHSGTPVGSTETLHGLRTYITRPPAGVEPKGVIVIIPDAFGWELVNSRILADNYAQKGQFVVYLPDFMNGHYLSEQMLSVFNDFEVEGAYGTKILAGVKAARHFGPFILHNRIGVVRPRILSFFDRIRADPGTSGLPVGAAGFCWGGKFTAVLCNGLIDGKPNTRIDAGFAAHPSQLAIPGDIRNITKPLSVAVGDNDLQLGAAGLDKLKKLLDARTVQAGLKQQVVVYPGAKHGFAVRGDPADEKQKRQGLEAEQQAIAWFSNTLIKAA